MVGAKRKKLQDRAHAAHLLALKVASYKQGNAIVVGVGHGGCFVGLALARELDLPFEAVFCREVKHPADSQKTVGSVSDGVVLINQNTSDIPQDFLVRQVATMQYAIEKEYRFMYGNRQRPSFNKRTVILVVDVLNTPDSLLAGIKMIKVQDPLQIVVAVPVVSPRAAAEIAGEVNDLLFVHLESGKLDGSEIYDHYPAVDPVEIRNSIALTAKAGN